MQERPGDDRAAQRRPGGGPAGPAAAWLRPGFVDPSPGGCSGGCSGGSGRGLHSVLVFFVLCALFCVLCSVFFVLCSLFFVLSSLFFVLCSFCFFCSLFLCALFFVVQV
jgi:hypothetical protein